MAATTTMYHWVHKNTKSTSFSSAHGADLTEIRRFVQHQRLSKRREELRILWSKESAAVEDVGLEDRSITEDAGLDPVGVEKIERQPGKSVAKYSRPGRRRRKSSKLQVSRRRRQKLEHEDEDQQPKDTIHPWTGSTIDPFNTSSILGSPDVGILLKYFIAAQSAGGNAYKLHLLPRYLQDVVKIEQIVRSSWINYLHYEHSLYAMLAFMAVRLLVITKVKLSNVKTPEHYMSKAISSLRKRLQQSDDPALEVDHATIGAINQIALANWTAGDLKAARVHLEVLASMIQNIGIEQVHGRFLIESIRTLDVQVALEVGQMPFLPAAPSFESLPQKRMEQIRQHLHRKALRTTADGVLNDFAVRLGYDPRHPSDILEDFALTLDLRLAHELEEIIMSDILCPSIRPMLQNVIHCLTLAKYVWLTTEATSQDVRYMCRTARTLVHHLWTYGFDHADDGQDKQFLLTDCVRLTMVIYLTLATNRMAVRASAVLASKLCLACQQLHGGELISDAERRLYLWLLITGASVADNHAYEKSWFLQEAARTAGSLSIVTYEALHECMTRYLYSWTMQMTTLQGVINTIETQ